MSRIVYVQSTAHPGASSWPVGQAGLKVGNRLAVQHGDRIVVVSAGLYMLRDILDNEGQEALEEWDTSDRASAACATDEGTPAHKALEEDTAKQARRLLTLFADGEPACQVIAPMQERERTMARMLNAQAAA